MKLKTDQYSVDAEDDIFTAEELRGTLDRPAEKTCSLCGEPLTTKPELNLGICDVCKHEREDLDSAGYVPVDIYMLGRGEYETLSQRQINIDYIELDEGHDFSEDADYLS